MPVSTYNIIKTTNIFTESPGGIVMGLQTCGLNLNNAQKELYPHGTPGFPCAAYEGFYTDRPEQTIPWHWHEELEMAYVKSGSIKFQIPSGSFLLTQGDCIIINSNILHTASGFPKCQLLSLVFHPRLITGTSDSAFATKYLSPLVSYGPFDGFLFRDKEHPLRTSSFLQAYEALACDAPGFEFTVRTALSQICYFLYEQFQPKINSKETGENPDKLRIRMMLEYIHEHFSEPVALSDIAKTADIGERECLRCFKRNIQLSPMQYLLKYRVMKGAELLLREPEKSVSQIALRCGFDSPSHFSKMFRRFYDCSPKEHRNTANTCV